MVRRISRMIVEHPVCVMGHSQIECIRVIRRGHWPVSRLLPCESLCYTNKDYEVRPRVAFVSS